MEQKYIKPIIKIVTVASENLMECSVNNRVGNGVQLGKSATFEEEEDY